MVIEERRAGLFIATLEDGTEYVLREAHGGLDVTAVEGVIAIRPAVANRLNVQVVEQ